ncbi:MAG: hypothetical protein LBT55_06265 [Clostridiaceae bacterium]|jgi:hypothetical protein|nr:hypothetical protein [Clostridiaceae bacterium]
MDYWGYEVDSAFIDGEIIKWVNTGNGETVIARKGGEKYFIKRDMHARCPSKGDSDTVRKIKLATQERVNSKQKELKVLMKGLDSRKDRVVVEEYNFWDTAPISCQFVTVTLYIDNKVDKDFDFSTLDRKSFIKLCCDMVEPIKLLHERGIIHGDLKESNILIADESGKYVPYIIDFDSSYPAKSIAKYESSIGGSPGYESPEIALYTSEEGASAPETVTIATDIFSLGLIFHLLWTKDGAGHRMFPATDIGDASIGEAVYSDGNIFIDKKFDCIIGDKCGATLMSLINWMLAKDPADRPTAGNVIDVLSDTLSVPAAFHKGSDVKPFDTELWGDHKLVAHLYTVETLKKKGVRMFKRINDGGYLKYLVLVGDKEVRLSIDEICREGYAKRENAKMCEPWEEHLIEFEPLETITEAGYIAIDRLDALYGRRYTITQIGGRSFDKGYRWLIEEGLAHPKSFKMDVDTPWPEHGTAYADSAYLTERKVKSIARVEYDGEHRYRITFTDGHVNDAIKVNNMKILRYIK